MRGRKATKRKQKNTGEENKRSKRNWSTDKRETPRRDDEGRINHGRKGTKRDVRYGEPREEGGAEGSPGERKPRGR